MLPKVDFNESLIAAIANQRVIDVLTNALTSVFTRVINDTIGTRLDALSLAIKELKDENVRIVSRCDELKAENVRVVNRFDQLKAENVRIESRYDELVGHNEKLRDQLAVQCASLEELERYTHRDNLIIHGLPERTAEALPLLQTRTILHY